MKYRLILTKRFEKDVKRCVKRGLPMEKFKKVIRLLEETGRRSRWPMTSASG